MKVILVFVLIKLITTVVAIVDAFITAIIFVIKESVIIN